jgi:hypothetical protein
MSAIENVARLWKEAEPDIPFGWLITDCLYNGVVIAKPGFVLIAKLCWSDGKTLSFAKDNPDNCWFVYAAQCDLGDGARLVAESAPHRTEYFAYRRRGKDKIYNWSQIDRRF